MQLHDRRPRRLSRIPAVQQRYHHLAHTYDRRWRVYLRQTLERALTALSLSGTEHILDVGCGTGEFERMAVARFPKLTIVGLDATPAMLEEARAKLAGCPRVSFQIGSVETLPFAEGRFDAVVCANVLHHLRDPQQALQECVRVLHQGGQLIVVDWCRDFWHCRLMHGWLRLFDRTYAAMPGLADLQKGCEELGLTVERVCRFMAKPCYGMLCVAARKSM